MLYEVITVAAFEIANRIAEFPLRLIPDFTGQFGGPGVRGVLGETHQFALRYRFTGPQERAR